MELMTGLVEKKEAFAYSTSVLNRKWRIKHQDLSCLPLERVSGDACDEGRGQSGRCKDVLYQDCNGRRRHIKGKWKWPKAREPVAIKFNSVQAHIVTWAGLKSTSSSGTERFLGSQAGAAPGRWRCNTLSMRETEQTQMRESESSRIKRKRKPC